MLSTAGQVLGDITSGLPLPPPPPPPPPPLPPPPPPVHPATLAGWHIPAAVFHCNVGGHDSRTEKPLIQTLNRSQLVGSGRQTTLAVHWGSSTPPGGELGTGKTGDGAGGICAGGNASGNGTFAAQLTFSAKSQPLCTVLNTKGGLHWNRTGPEWSQMKNSEHTCGFLICVPSACPLHIYKLLT